MPLLSAHGVSRVRSSRRFASRLDSFRPRPGWGGMFVD
ncbi:hypothetical protein BPSOL_0219 [Bifidobacterium pseudolongum]|nr:hypothetical protein BPSOL_0219 [Bifidobacterium pseudolongum]